MKVIDVSAWQENIDWQAVIDAGIEGVIIKIGERDMLDGMFISHVNTAVDCGLKYGVYYYAHADTPDEAIAEADTVAGWLQTYLRGETPELGIWYDAEAYSMTRGDVTATCMAFLNRLSDYGHQYEGIYASWNWLSKDGARYIDVDRLPDYVPLWSAQYNSHDDLSDEYPGRVRIWQYSDHFSDDLPYDADEYYTE